VGERRFTIGDQTFTAKAGDTAYAQRGIPHHFTILTETAKALMIITPAGLETFFKEFSIPAQNLNLPPMMEGKPTAEFFDFMLKRAEELGIVWMPEV
jgi:hypothetical protein